MTGCGGTTWRIDYRGRFVAPGDLCMEIPGDTEASSTTARLGPCSFAPSQGWAMSGKLRLRGRGLCAAAREGKTTAFTPLVLVDCNAAPTELTFKTNPDGKLHLTDADCITNQQSDSPALGLNRNDAIVRTCTWGTLESAPNMELTNGDVKQAGRDECLVATDLAVGAKVQFASCRTAASRREWDFGPF